MLTCTLYFPRVYKNKVEGESLVQHFIYLFFIGKLFTVIGSALIECVCNLLIKIFWLEDV